MLTYDHSVKVNGKWFRAGEQVVAPALNTAKVEQTVVTNDTEERADDEKSAKRSYTKRK